jgi:hypothetical protein
VDNVWALGGTNTHLVEWEIEYCMHEGMRLHNLGVSSITLRRSRAVQVSDYSFDHDVLSEAYGSRQAEKVLSPSQHGKRYTSQLVKAAQRKSFRAYLQGLLLPRDRNKTLTTLAGARPVEEGQHPQVQKLSHFLLESPWDGEAINARRLDLPLADPSDAHHKQTSPPDGPAFTPSRLLTGDHH